jgi:hypothetical protein
MNLRKELPRIAARVLANTHVFPKHLKEKYELIAAAFGAARVVADFEAWCEEVKEENPRYPLTKYMIVVDSRLGRASAEAEPDLKDPTLAEIGALSYKLTGVTPSARALAKLRLSYEADEIKAALTEYASTLEEKDFKSGMRTFFTDGGATAVIYARRNRK